MSYILDALKKSERQRPPGPVPDLFTVHGPQPPAPRRPVRATVVVALFLVVPAFILWVWTGAGRRDEGPGRPPAAASLQLRAETPAAPVTPQPRAEIPAAPVTTRPPAAPISPVPARAAAAAPRLVDDRPQTPVPPAQKPGRAAAPPKTAAPLVVGTAVPAVLPAPAAPHPASATAVIPISPAPVASAPAAMPPPPQTGGEVPAAPVTAVAAPEEVPPADGRVLNLAELPAPIRAELPQLLVSGHVWSEEPSLRLLSVDDRLLHEGGEAAPGVSLQEITPVGAVFVYRGWHFRVAGARP